MQTQHIQAYSTIYEVQVELLYIRFTFGYTKEFEAKTCFKRCFRVCGSDFSRVQYILFALEDLHQCSKPADPSMESNPHQFGPPTDNPHRHHRKEEEDSHLHTGDNKSKA
jgi:hypothetical protein